MTLKEIIDSRFGGKLQRGKHTEDGEACILEAVSVLKLNKWTDDPQTLNIFDLRPLNDINVSPETRTTPMIELAELYENSLSWPNERKVKIISSIVILTVNRIITKLPFLSKEIRKKCRDAHNLTAARAAARAAANAAARAAASADPYAAARAAASAAARAAANAAARAAASADPYAAASAAANAAAYAAARAAASAAASAAEAAARAAASAARAAADDAAVNDIFNTAVKIWKESIVE